MNAAQTGLYWREWSLARDWFRSHGRGVSQADEMRHTLHERTLGRTKSSKDFTNADLDKVLASFRAIHDGGNLDAQLAAEDQPEHRHQALVANVRDLASGCVSREGTERAYLDGLAKKLFGADRYQDLDERRLQQLRGVLFKRLAQLRKKVGKTEAAAAGCGPNPF